LKSDIYTIGELMQNSQATLNAMAKAGMNAFNFATSTATATGSAVFASRAKQGFDYAEAVEKAVKGFLNNSEGQLMPSIFLSNHDMDRWVSTFEEDRYSSIANMYLLTPGTPWVYYGEEIMMRGYRATAQTDANRRLPMQWRNNGTSDPARCNPIPGNDYRGEQTTYGALDKIKEQGSVTASYKATLAFRDATPAIRKGIYRSVTPEEAPICAFDITYAGETSYLIHNVTAEPVDVVLPDGYGIDTSLGQGESVIEGGKLVIPGYSCVYLTMAN